jgi:hypothetical protein
MAMDFQGLQAATERTDAGYYSMNLIRIPNISNSPKYVLKQPKNQHTIKSLNHRQLNQIMILMDTGVKMPTGYFLPIGNSKLIALVLNSETLEH